MNHPNQDDDTHSVVSNATTRTSRGRFLDPALHSYLGEQQETPSEVRSQELLPYHTYDMLLYPVHELVVFPGSTLPIRLQNRDFIRRLQAMMAMVNETNQGEPSSSSSSSSSQPQRRQLVSTHIGIIQIMVNPRTNRLQTATHGTTIALASTHSGTTLDDEEVIFKSTAKHRFQVIKLKSTRVVVEAAVMILPDTPLYPTIAKYSGQDAMPHWLYDVHSPRRLARILYQRWKSSLLLEVCI